MKNLQKTISKIIKAQDLREIEIGVQNLNFD
jgi:hypothetical protein